MGQVNYGCESYDVVCSSFISVICEISSLFMINRKISVNYLPIVLVLMQEIDCVL